MARSLAELGELPDVALLSLEEAAALSHVHEDTVRRAADRGELPLIELSEPGARRPLVRVELGELRAWWQRRSRDAHRDSPSPLPPRRTARTLESHGTLRVSADMGRDA
jgi:hypothetical protein